MKTLLDAMMNLHTNILTYLYCTSAVIQPGISRLISGGRIFGNRIQSNDYLEVIGALDYRSQKVIVTKYPDPFASPDAD